MKKSFFIFLTILLSANACHHEAASLHSSCVKQFLINNNLLAYVGQDLGCNFYVSLFELDGKEYFYTDSPCADMISIPVDCDGANYCPSIYSPEMEYFFNNAVNTGIVGVKP